MSAYSPVTDWWPVQAIPCLRPTVLRIGFSNTTTPKANQRAQKMNRCQHVSKSMSVTLYGYCRSILIWRHPHLSDCCLNAAVCVHDHANVFQTIRGRHDILKILTMPRHPLGTCDQGKRWAQWTWVSGLILIQTAKMSVDYTCHSHMVETQHGCSYLNSHVSHLKKRNKMSVILRTNHQLMKPTREKD